jgi:two-component system NtrC family sensor kinase
VTLGSRIRIALALVGTLPVILLGGLAVQAARQELTSTVGASLARQASSMARACETYTLDRLRGLRQTAGYLPFDRLSRVEISAALAIPYRQSSELQILVLLGPDGAPVSDPVYSLHPELDAGLAGHEPVEAEALAAFGRAVPLAAALQAGLALGPAYRAPGSGGPGVALAVRAGAAGDKVLAAELSLSALARRLLEQGGPGGALLVNGDVEPLAGGLGSALSSDERALLRDGVAPGGQRYRLIERGDGRRWLAGVAPVGELGWAVMVAQPEEEAFRAVGRVHLQTAIGAAASLALALLLGVALARALTHPVRRLTQAAEALTEGRFDAPLPPPRSDELGTLAGAFAHMTAEVGRRDAEIRAWNAELQARVEHKTGELKAAEDQIARTRRLTALGSLSAGVAQGLNDPLTSLAGLISLAQRDVGAGTRVGQQLGTALEQARRATRVVQDLRRLAAPGRLEGARRFQLERPVAAALERHRDVLVAAGVDVLRETEEGLPPMEGDPEQIETLVGRLVDNAVSAMPGGGQLTVSLGVVDGSALRLVIGDTGRGIPEALRERIFDPFFSTSHEGGAGLGLTLAHGIVEAHHGRIDVESAEGRGTAFTIHFPAAAAPAWPG